MSRKTQISSFIKMLPFLLRETFEILFRNMLRLKIFLFFSILNEREVFNSSEVYLNFWTVTSEGPSFYFSASNLTGQRIQWNKIKSPDSYLLFLGEEKKFLYLLHFSAIEITILCLSWDVTNRNTSTPFVFFTTFITV